eukprot:c13801_g1_i1.p1 GENE.c13801_g1_i1~~c13801_g1_i1.p1  ORF type:complete len:2012 (+),score=168.95 c13801_g1_i1:725-6037(+)
MIDHTGVCERVPCPSGSDGHPLCQCLPGRTGSLIWDPDTQSFSGNCASCSKGFWTDAPFEPCHMVHGPKNSMNHPDVTCKDGFGGDVLWNDETGEYEGECTECPAGTWSTTREITCERISCPENAEGWPDCKCIPGYTGKLKFTHGQYIGVCLPCSPGTSKSDYGSHACQVCEMGYTSGHHSSHCHKVACPDSSSGHPFCRCDALTAGTIEWNPAGMFSGECTACPVGMFPSKDHTKCVPFNCPFGSTWPECKCREGFYGTPFAHAFDGRVYGNCSRCPSGYWCPPGRICPTVHECMVRDCPANSHGAPHCICNDGFVGELSWNELAGHYEGKCAPCPKSQWSNETTKSSMNGCFPVACPPGSEGFPNCQCKLGFVGTPTWDDGTGSWQGTCAQCSTGTFSSSYSDLTCSQVQCPAFSSGWPHCTCLSDHPGELHWDAKMGSWVGFCSDGSCPEFTTGYPYCKCIEGYAGDFHWSEKKLNFDGSCRPCEPGTWSKPGSAQCDQLECPENSQGWPDCRCEAGYYGTLTATQGKSYLGTCEPCGPGFWSEAGDNECYKVPCSEFAYNHPNCECGVNYAGHIAWYEGRWQGECILCPFGSFSALGSEHCSPIPCPPGAAGWPRCRCEEGYEGVIELYPNETSYRGSCTRCSTGYSSSLTTVEISVDPVFSSRMTCQAVDCPGNSRSWPFCHCTDGFQGALQLIGDTWYGSCTPCPRGFLSQFVTGGPGPRQCILKPCPEHSTNHPNCACQQGYHGTVDWVVTEAGGSFMGACEECIAGKYAPTTGLDDCRPCPAGNWSRRGAAWCDIRLACPSNSVLTAEGECECEANHFGIVHLDRASGKARGQCLPCRVGYSALPGSSSCTKVPCPDSATDSHPFCRCPEGMGGQITFNGKLGKYDGRCERCPLGQWPSVTGACKAVSCPKNSERTSEGLCRCSGNTRGAIQWNSETGKFIGQCAPCEGKGYAVSQDRTSCVPVPCPEYASFHPNCVCQAGYFGKLTWSTFAGVWQGTCQSCPTFSYSTLPGRTEQCITTPCPLRSARSPSGECVCTSGNTGTLTFNRGAWKGTCSSAECPHNSHLEQRVCVCNEGFGGQSVSVDTYAASKSHMAEKQPCTPCRPGEVRDDSSGKCVAVDCPPNSSFWPQCVCQPGFIGKIRWNGFNFEGSCELCPVGFVPSDDGSHCRLVPCPIGTFDHPVCSTSPAYAGAVTWDSTKRVYVGEVHTCDVGSVAKDGYCEKVDCPPFSSGWPKCLCDESHSGFVAWVGDSFESHCEPCPEGTRSEKGTACKTVPLPLHAIDPSQPRCEAGYAGKVEWDSKALKYTGECIACEVGSWSTNGQCAEVPCPATTVLKISSFADKTCLCEPPLQGVFSFSFGEWIGQCIDMPELPKAPPKTEPIGPSASPSPVVQPSVVHPAGSCLARRAENQLSDCELSCIEDGFLGGEFVHKQCCRGECSCVDELGVPVPSSTHQLTEGPVTCKGINCINLSAHRQCISSLGSRQSLQLPNTFVVEGWVNPHFSSQFSETIQPILAGLRDEGRATTFVAGILDEEGQSFPYIRLHGDELIGRIPLKAHTWHHLAFVFDMHESEPESKPSLTLYVNGTKDSLKQLETISRADLVTETADEEIVIGHASIDGTEHIFTGSLGEITVWHDRIRTDQIQQVMLKKPIGEKSLFRARFLDSGRGTPQLIFEREGAEPQVLTDAITCATLECTDAPGFVRELIPISVPEPPPPVKKAPVSKFDQPSPSPAPRQDPRPIVMSAQAHKIVFEGGIEFTIQ